MKDILLITLGVIGGSTGTLYFLRREFKRLANELKMPRQNNDILFESRDEANKISEQIFNLMNSYGYISVADLYDLIGETTTFENTKIGWYDLSGMRITGYGNRYMLKMPKTITLN